MLECHERSFVALSALKEQRSDQLKQSFRTNGLSDEISALRQVPGLRATRPDAIRTPISCRSSLTLRASSKPLMLPRGISTSVTTTWTSDAGTR